MATIRIANITDIPAIESLLRASQLITGVAKELIADFCVAEEQGKLVGVAGMENCGEGIGLLRSFAVQAEYRNRGIAKLLYKDLLAHARRLGVSHLYLLTTGAQEYFFKLGFVALRRAQAPEAIKSTQQFRMLCPDSAVLMWLDIQESSDSEAAHRENTMQTTLIRAILAGWIGGFMGNGLLGAVFSSPMAKAVLYDTNVQSQLFLSVTPQRNIAVSVVGLIVLSGIHGLLYSRLNPSIPGRTWLMQGLAWGGMIWASYWLFQEWFIYITLLGEPLLLAAFELLVLLAGSLLEGVVIAKICAAGSRMKLGGKGMQ